MRLRSLVLVASVVALSACNSILDFSAYKVEAAASDAGGEAGETGTGNECATNAECIAKLGDFSICRKQDFKCAKLLSPDCPAVLGDWKNDNAVILGSIEPVIGVDKSGGIPLVNAMSVALDDFKSGGNGLPPAAGSTARRPIVIVSCSEESDDPNDSDAPTRSAKHLVDNVKVPAIIGCSYSGDTQQASQVTIPAGVLLMSPTATSVAITDIDDKGLVWRTSPSDIIQVAALTALMPQIEASTRARLGLLAGDQLRVLVVNKGDSYGQGLATALQTSLQFNGKSVVDNGLNFNAFNFGDPSSGTAVNYDATRVKILPPTGLIQTAPPHVVFLLGTNEVITEFFKQMEGATWPGNKKPTYLFADGGLVSDLWTEIANRDELRGRVFGTVPGTNNAIYQLFRSRYTSFITDGTSVDTGGTAAAYDALYLLAYAIAAQPDKPVTGANINEGLKRLVPPGPLSSPGTTNINSAYAALSSGKNIDYNGASGPLDFNVMTGEAPSDIQIWCVPTETKTLTGKAGPGINSSVFYDATKGAISGAIDDTKTKMNCNFP